MIAADRLGLGVRVTASSEIFALTAGGCPMWARKLFGRGNVRGEYVEGEMSYIRRDRDRAGAIWTGARVLMNSAARRREIGRYDTILGRSDGGVITGVGQRL